MRGKVIDVTFHGGRRQNEIENEIQDRVTTVSSNSDNNFFEEDITDIPDVVTYDTMKEYCLAVIKNTPKNNQKKRRVYAGLINLIDENNALKEENRKLKMEELKSQDDEIIQELENEENNK